MEKKNEAEHTAAFDATAAEDSQQDQPLDANRPPEALPDSQLTDALSAEEVIRKQHDVNTTTIDGLEILEEVARGGMGAVLRARDKSLNREVAVKVLLNKQRPKPDMVRRFVEEAQIGGQLQHPGIVPVYGFGKFADDCPYFTMKLVKGRTLSSMLKERKDLAVERAKFLKIFDQLCQTVAYAHSKNVIHRDLKPANVMVGSFGEVQVMDWGLAKVLGAATAPKKPAADADSRATTVRTLRSSPTGTVAFEASDTQSGSILGTPAYMAPEQAIGDVENLDARADVFGLGAILCEILTGRPPYVGASVTKTLHKALRAELNDAFAALDGCTADEELVTINKACLAADPDHRPKDAGALVERLTEYLESVETRLQIEQLGRIEAQTKAVEEAKRRKSQLRYASLAGCVLLAGIAGTAWGLLQAKSALIVAEQAKADEAAQRTLAEQRKADADRERDRAVAAEKETRAFSDFLVDKVLATPRPRGVQQGLGVDVTMSEALSHAQLQMADSFSGRPKAEATARYALGITWRNLGRYAEAESQLRQSAKLRGKEYGEDSPELLQTLNQLAIALIDQAKYDEAATLLKRVHETRKHTLGDDNAETLAVLTNLAVNFKRNGEPAKAIGLLERVREAQAATLGATHEATLKTLNNLAEAYRASGKPAEAIALHEQVCDGFEQSVGANNALTLTARNNLALSLRDAKRLPEAIAVMEKVRSGRIAAIKRDHPNTLNTTHSLAVMYLESGRTKEAIELFEEVRAARVKKFGFGNLLTLRTLRDLAATYQRLGKFDEALGVLRQLIDGIAKLPKPNRSEVAIAKSMLGDVLVDAKRLDEAEPNLVQGLDELIANLSQVAPSERKKESLAALDRLMRYWQKRGRPELVAALQARRTQLEQSK